MKQSELSCTVCVLSSYKHIKTYTYVLSNESIQVVMSYVCIYFRLLHQIYMATVKRKCKLLGDKTSYKDLVHIELPRGTHTRKCTSTVSQRCEKIFQTEIVVKEGSKVKVHYIGYSKKHDE